MLEHMASYQPTSTVDWQSIPMEFIPVTDVRPRARSTNFWSTVRKLFNDWSAITDDYCIYVLDSSFGYILVDGHHRLQAAIWKRKHVIEARVAR